MLLNGRVWGLRCMSFRPSQCKVQILSRESIEDVPGDPFHDPVAAAQSVGPVRRADSDNSPPLG